MPVMQVALGPLNSRFGPRRVADKKLNPAEAFAEGVRLADLLDADIFAEAGGAKKGSPAAKKFVGAARTYIDSMPEAIHEAIRAIIRANLQRAEPLPITFAWQPGYDWELSVSDIASTDMTTGGITIILRSRYPDDRHPLDQSGKQKGQSGKQKGQSGKQKGQSGKQKGRK